MIWHQTWRPMRGYGGHGERYYLPRRDMGRAVVYDAHRGARLIA